MTHKFDIMVNFTMIAKDEQEAEQELLNYLKTSSRVMDVPNLVDYEFIEFVPKELAQSCCC